MKKFSGIILLFSSFFFLAVPALADDESSINAQVTTQEISVTVSGNFPINYGTLGFGETSAIKRDFNVENTGSILERIDFKGEDASNGTVTWLLAESSAENTYCHYYDIDQDNSYTYFYPDYRVVASALNPNANFSFSTHLKMPSSSTGTGTFNTKIWVRATASN